MSAIPADNQVLPPLRQDLELHRGPDDPDGSPTWAVLDPVTGVYHRIGWSEVEVLRRLGRSKSLGRLMAEVETETTLDLDRESVLDLCRQAAANQLTESSGVADPRLLEARYRAVRPHPLVWLLRHYLFIRIPLLRPDALLGRTLPWVRLLASRVAILLYAVLFAVGLVLLLPRLETYLRTFPYWFTWEGALAYAGAIVVVKAIHEFSHAYTAKGLGVRVPAMGIAFMVFMPVAFCDVTDGWKLSRRRDRLLISLAGILAECVIAGVSLFGWAVTAPGFFHSLFFVLSSLTLLSTLMVNLNPAMRFDGYYILMDLWGVDNLQARAFAMTRWALRRWLLGVEADPPEVGVGLRRLLGFVFYSLYAWTYRFFLYIGIAVLVYLRFGKALGAILFATEIGIFIVRPAVDEAMRLARMRGQLRLNVRMLCTMLLLTAAALWLLLPFPRRVPLAAAVVPGEESQAVYTPADGILVDLRVRRGVDVEAGEILFRVRSDEQQGQMEMLQQEARVLESRIRRRLTDPDQKAGLRDAREALARVESRLVSQRQSMAQRTVRAEVDGRVVEWGVGLREGLPVARDIEVGRIQSPEHTHIVAFVEERDRDALYEGKQVHFQDDGYGAPRPARVVSVGTVREETLEIVSLASVSRGELPTVPGPGNTLLLRGSFFRVEVELEDDQARPEAGRIGRVWIHSAPRSIAAEALRRAWRVLLRESGA